MSDTILIIPSSFPPPRASDGEKGLLSGVSGALAFDSDSLRQSLASFLKSMDLILANLPQQSNAYELDEIELKVEVNAEGSIQLVGGIKAGATGGMTLRMKRQK